MENSSSDWPGFRGARQRLGIIEFEFLARKAQSYPSEVDLASGEIVHVVDGRMEKWACLRCPGGCGAIIPLSLSQKRRPRWEIALDWFGRPTVTPSVHQQNNCRCHFWIRQGRIDWCKDGRPVQGRK